MIINPFEMPARDAYQLLISSVVPRPIAWVSTISEDGIPNLAPYSFFMALTGDPPMLAISCNWRRTTNSKKDTLTNVEATGEFVINVATEAMSAKINLTSAELPPEINEFSQVGLTQLNSEVVKAPRVAESPINIECKLNQVVYLGREGNQAGLIIGEAVMWHVQDEFLTPQKTVDVTKLHAIGRLSYSYYTRTNDLFEMRRPD